MKLQRKDLVNVMVNISNTIHRGSAKQVRNQTDQGIYQVVHNVIKRRVNGVIDQIYDHVYEHFVDYEYTNRT